MVILYIVPPDTRMGGEDIGSINPISSTSHTNITHNNRIVVNLTDYPISDLLTHNHYFVHRDHQSLIDWFKPQREDTIAMSISLHIDGLHKLKASPWITNRNSCNQGIFNHTIGPIRRLAILVLGNVNALRCPLCTIRVRHNPSKGLELITGITW